MRNIVVAQCVYIIYHLRVILRSSCSPFPHRPCNMSSNSWSANVWTFVIAWLFCHVPCHGSKKAPDTIENTSKSDRQLTAWRRYHCSRMWWICMLFPHWQNPWWSLITALPFYINTIMLTTTAKIPAFFDKSNLKLKCHRPYYAQFCFYFWYLFIRPIVESVSNSQRNKYKKIEKSTANADYIRWFIFCWKHIVLSQRYLRDFRSIWKRMQNQNGFAIVWFTDDDEDDVE